MLTIHVQEPVQQFRATCDEHPELVGEGATEREALDKLEEQLFGGAPTPGTPPTPPTPGAPPTAESARGGQRGAPQAGARQPAPSGVRR